MFQGKVESAIHLLDHKSGGTVLHLEDMVSGQDKSVRDILKEKHPVRAGLDSASPPPPVHPVVFDRLDAATIHRVVRRTKGAAGPSGLDAHCWRRMCTSFKEASNNLCHALALSARRLCTSYIDPVIIAPLMANRLIALDKSPGVRPIGIGNTSRRIIAKSILSILKYDVIDAAGVDQLCVGQIAGAEAAVHSVRKLFELSEAVLFVDASNAFNSLNHLTAMYNLQFVCPALATPLINCYRNASDLFVDGDVIRSQEGATQGDPLSMSFYALGTIPLINELRERCDVRQIWNADDATAVGSISALRDWWDVLNSRGPGFGYHPNACKTWLVTKEGSLGIAKEMFEGTQVQITDQGRPHLGSPIGTDMFIDQFAREKVDKWLDELETLAKIASTQPHAAYACLTHGLYGKWTYFLRSTPTSLIQDQVARLERCISSIVIPAITGRPPTNEKVRKIMALPVQLGGLGIRDLVDRAPDEYKASIRLCSSIVGNVESGNQSMDYDCEVAQMEARNNIKAERERIAKQRQNELMDSLEGVDRMSMELASEKGASSWLSALPLSEYGYVLHKRAFFDALALRYGWQPNDLPVRCECGAS